MVAIPAGTQLDSAAHATEPIACRSPDEFARHVFDQLAPQGHVARYTRVQPHYHA
jgi:hypothetical protein